MLVWKCCHYFQSTPLSVSTSFSRTPWHAHDPWELPRGTAASASPRPLPDPLCSSTFPYVTRFMSCCCGLCHQKGSVLGFAGPKLQLGDFEWSGLIVGGGMKSHQALPTLYVVSICSYSLLYHSKGNVWLASSARWFSTSNFLTSPLHTSRRKGRIWRRTITILTSFSFP